MGDLGGNLEEEVVLDIASRRGPFIGGHGEAGEAIVGLS